MGSLAETHLYEGDIHPRPEQGGATVCGARLMGFDPVYTVCISRKALR
jgi:hypothetical protein